MEERPYYRFDILDEYPVAVEEDFENNQISVPYHTDIYHRFEFCNPRAKEKITNYLIKTNEKGLIDTFVQIENDVLESLIYKKVREETKCIKYQEINRIKKLSWLKRLFNKF